MTRGATSGGAGTWRCLSLVVSDAAVLFGQLQAVTESIGAGLAPPIVCFERWTSPTLILGTGQRSADADLAACRTRGIPVVWRLAGGTAVYATSDYLSFPVVAPPHIPSSARISPQPTGASARPWSRLVGHLVSPATSSAPTKRERGPPRWHCAPAVMAASPRMRC